MDHEDELIIKEVVGCAVKSNHTGIPNTYPTIQERKPILESYRLQRSTTLHPQFGVLSFQLPEMSKSDRCFMTIPLILLLSFYWNWYSPPTVSILENTQQNTQTYIILPIQQTTNLDALSVASLHEATPRHRIHCLVWRI